MSIFRARRPILPRPVSFANSPGSLLPKAVTAREADRPGDPGRAVVLAHAPLPGEYAPPPARLVQAPVPMPAGRVVAGGSYPGMEPPAPVQAPALVRGAERPGHAGQVICLGFAPPEEPTPRPLAVVRIADTVPPGSVQAAGSRPPADNLPPPVPGGVVRDRGRQPGGDGWAYARGTTGPPEPRPLVGLVVVREGEAVREPGRVLASGSYDFGLSPGLYLPAVRVVCQAERAGFAGRATFARAAVDSVTPQPDPIFPWYTNTTVRLRSRRGKT